MIPDQTEYAALWVDLLDRVRWLQNEAQDNGLLTEQHQELRRCEIEMGRMSAARADVLARLPAGEREQAERDLAALVNARLATLTGPIFSTITIRVD